MKMNKLDEKFDEQEEKLKSLLGIPIHLIRYTNNGDFHDVLQSMIEGFKEFANPYLAENPEQEDYVTKTLIINWAITAMAAFAMEQELLEMKRKQDEE